MKLSVCTIRLWRACSAIFAFSDCNSLTALTLPDKIDEEMKPSFPMSVSSTTLSIEPEISYESTATTLTVTCSYTEGDAEIVSQRLVSDHHSFTV